MILSRVLGQHDGEIRNLRIRGVDGADVSYPGAHGGAVGGSSRRERYSVPGTAPLGKRSVISFHFIELVLEITVLEMLAYTEPGLIFSQISG